MHDKLTCQFSIDKSNVEWRKMEVHPHSTSQFFYPLICRKVVATGCKQQPKGGILNAENGYGHTATTAMTRKSILRNTSRCSPNVIISLFLLLMFRFGNIGCIGLVLGRLFIAGLLFLIVRGT